MTGGYCYIPGCTNDCSVKGRGFFKLPCVKKEHYKKWRKDWFDILVRVREYNGFTPPPPFGNFDYIKPAALDTAKKTP